ncbi:MAG: PAS domain S-box protein [Anaerolineae bacterium]|nr:PAS domain S-box protein [Anaerolineae bacterium]
MQRQARLLAGMMLLIIAGVILIVVIITVFAPPAFNWLHKNRVVTLGSIVILAVPYALSRTRYYQWGAAITLGLITLMVFVGSIPDRVPAHFDLLFFLVCPILLSTVFFQPRTTVVYVLMCLVVMLCLPVLIPTIPVDELLTGPVTLVWIMSALMLGLDQHRRRIEADRQAVIRASESRYRLLIEQASDGIVVIGPLGDYLEVNPAFCTMLGYTPDELLRFNVNDPILSEDLSVMPFPALAGSTGLLKRCLRRKDGTPLIVEISGRRLEDGRLQAMVRDITERQRAEEALRQSEAAEREQRVLAEALRNTTAALVSTLDPQVVMNRILDNLDRVVPYEAANIMLVEGSAIRFAYWRGYPGEVDNFFRKGRLLLNSPTLYRMWTTGQPAFIEDTMVDPDWIVYAETNWIRSHTAAPIHIQGQVIGFLSLDSSRPGFFTAAHTERLQAFADQAAVAIENAQLYDEMLHYASQLEHNVAQRTAELYRSKERVEAVLTNSSDAIVVTLTNGIIEQTNPAFNIGLRYRPGEAEGIPMAMLVEPDKRDLLTSAFQMVVRGYQPERLELTVCRKDGSTFDADVALSPIVEPGSQCVTGIVCSLRDMTARKRMETGLRQALEKERELNELKTRFISIVSHEFRTPLATIQTTVDNLRLHLPRMTHEQKTVRFEKILTQIEHMTSLLEDVLALGRMESGRTEFNPETVDLNAFLREINDEFQQTRKIQQLTYVSSGNANPVRVDRKLMRQLFTNLLSNAAKYSPTGSPINIELVYEAEEVLIRVSDNGIGIPQKDQMQLFNAFYRAANVGSISGTGLGLAITKHAVDLHGGTITVESEIGKGTTFTVAIPTLQHALSA